MKKANPRRNCASDKDTMRPEYDFSAGICGATAKRYAEGSNVVAIDGDLLDVFPDGAAVNEALRALATVIRKRRLLRRRKTT